MKERIIVTPLIHSSSIPTPCIERVHNGTIPLVWITKKTIHIMLQIKNLKNANPLRHPYKSPKDWTAKHNRKNSHNQILFDNQERNLKRKGVRPVTIGNTEKQKGVLLVFLLYELFSWTPNELCFGHFHQRAAGKGHPPLRKPQNRPPSNIFCCLLIQNLFRLQNEFSKIFLW